MVTQSSRKTASQAVVVEEVDDEISDDATARLQYLMNTLNSDHIDNENNSEPDSTSESTVVVPADLTWEQVAENLEEAEREIDVVEEPIAVDGSVESLVEFARDSPAMSRLARANPKAAMMIWRRIDFRYSLILTCPEIHPLILRRFGIPFDDSTPHNIWWIGLRHMHFPWSWPENCLTHDIMEKHPTIYEPKMTKDAFYYKSQAVDYRKIAILSDGKIRVTQDHFGEWWRAEKPESIRDFRKRIAATYDAS